jgi:hypothetical protein
LIQKLSRAEVYNALALSIILYEIEIWTLKKIIENDLHQSRLNFLEQAVPPPILPQKK